MRYISGFSGATGYVYLSRNKKAVLTDSRYTIQAKEEAKGYEVLEVHGKYTELVNSLLEEEQPECFHPETGELMLGDIIISLDKVKEQAESYGHSTKREFAFLIVHSMLHLFGYDHMEEDEAAVMEQKQKEILDKMEIFR